MTENTLSDAQLAPVIYFVRGEKILLDRDLAKLYGIATKVLNQAVKRQAERFPSDFMFQLTNEEWDNLRSQIVTSKRGGLRYLPYAFTEQGVAMLSSVVNSPQAIAVNIAIMRAFVQMRQTFLENRDLADRLRAFEAAVVAKLGEHDAHFAVLFEAIDLLSAKGNEPRTSIGFKQIVLKNED